MDPGIAALGVFYSVEQVEGPLFLCVSIVANNNKLQPQSIYCEFQCY